MASPLHWTEAWWRSWSWLPSPTRTQSCKNPRNSMRTLGSRSLGERLQKVILISKDTEFDIIGRFTPSDKAIWGPTSICDPASPFSQSNHLSPFFTACLTPTRLLSSFEETLCQRRSADPFVCTLFFFTHSLAHTLLGSGCNWSL